MMNRDFGSAAGAVAIAAVLGFCGCGDNRTAAVPIPRKGEVVAVSGRNRISGEDIRRAEDARRNGEGRGSTRELIECGAVRFEGKAAIVDLNRMPKGGMVMLYPDFSVQSDFIEIPSSPVGGIVENIRFADGVKTDTGKGDILKFGFDRSEYTASQLWLQAKYIRVRSSDRKVLSAVSFSPVFRTAAEVEGYLVNTVIPWFSRFDPSAKVLEKQDCPKLIIFHKDGEPRCLIADGARVPEGVRARFELVTDFADAEIDLACLKGRSLTSLDGK